jgi:hypothetical protein
MATRGIRNNNPGNIRHGDQWRGLAANQPDPAFCTFVAPVYGIRAMVKILQSYQRRGLNTVQEIISAWAPTVENDTAAYVRSVCSRVGVGPNDPVEPGNPELIKAIIRHENGACPYSDNTIGDAIKLAGI